MKKQPRIFAVYDNKVVDMNHVVDVKQRFHLACCRVTDNAKSGHVVDGTKVYAVSQSFRAARIVTDNKVRDEVLTKVATREGEVRCRACDILLQDATSTASARRDCRETNNYEHDFPGYRMFTIPVATGK